MAAGMPVVRKRKEKHARQAGAEGNINVATENLRLGVLALPHGVDAKLGQQQRFVARNILQAIEVVRKGARFMKIDVEADEIETGWLQELRRGKLTNVTSRCGSTSLTIAASSSMKCARRLAPYQRAISGGISLASVSANTAG